MPTFDPAREWALFRAATQALTRIPVPAPHAPGALRAATRYFPALGALVGLAAAATFAAAQAGLPAQVASLLSLAATLLLTGALHEDGLADCADGLFGASTRGRALEIMRDSRIGAFGALALFTVLSTKILLVATVADTTATLVAAHATGRFWAVACAAALPYARVQGMAAEIASPGRTEIAIAAATAFATLLLLGPRIAPALLLSALVAATFFWYARHRLGGYTGDVLGATTVLTELSVLMAAAWHAA